MAADRSLPSETPEKKPFVRSLFARIFSETKPVHDALENLPYLRRYQSKVDLTLRDRYRHLRQLLPIYQALEDVLKKSPLAKVLETDLVEFMQRSEKIADDLALLKPYVSARDKDTVLSSTQKYVEKIKNLAEQGDYDRVLGHFYVRLLGDLHGGQITKKNVLRHYEIHQVTLPPNRGVSFYEFSEDAKNEFIRWMNTNKHNNLYGVVEAAKDAFKAHMPIFTELENTREPPSCYARFFTAKNVVMTAAAVLTSAVAVYSMSSQ